MDVQLHKLFLQYAYNPSLWIDNSHRSKFTSLLPEKLLNQAWRKDHFSLLLEQHLELGDGGELRSDELQIEAAKIMLLDGVKLKQLATHIGVCFIADDLRIMIDKQKIDNAIAAFGHDAIGFARNGQAGQCLLDAEQPETKVRRRKYADSGIHETIGIGFGVIKTAGQQLGIAWHKRFAYKMPKQIGETLEQQDVLPEDFCQKLLSLIVTLQFGEQQP